MQPTLWATGRRCSSGYRSVSTRASVFRLSSARGRWRCGMSEKVAIRRSAAPDSLVGQGQERRWTRSLLDSCCRENFDGADMDVLVTGSGWWRSGTSACDLHAHDRPAGATALVRLFALGTLAMGSAIPLLTPGGASEPMWRLNLQPLANPSYRMGAWGTTASRCGLCRCRSAPGSLRGCCWGYQLGVGVYFLTLRVIAASSTRLWESSRVHW